MLTGFLAVCCIVLTLIVGRQRVWLGHARMDVERYRGLWCMGREARRRREGD